MSATAAIIWFIVFYFLIGLLMAGMMIPTWEDKNSPYGFDYNTEVGCVFYLFWPIVLTIKIVKLLFYKMPMMIIRVIKLAINDELDKKPE